TCQGVPLNSFRDRRCSRADCSRTAFLPASFVCPGWVVCSCPGVGRVESLCGKGGMPSKLLGALWLVVADRAWDQNTGVAVKPNTTYQLTVGVGRRNAGFTPADNASRFGLYVANDAQAGGTLLGDAVYNASG
ncbi:MAG: hypothetical protein ACK55I_24265, partial [bacterium]